MTLLQVGSCGSALLHGTFIGGDGIFALEENLSFVPIPSSSSSVLSTANCLDVICL